MNRYTMTSGFAEEAPTYFGMPAFREYQRWIEEAIARSRKSFSLREIHEALADRDDGERLRLPYQRVIDVREADE